MGFVQTAEELSGWRLKTGRHLGKGRESTKHELGSRKGRVGQKLGGGQEFVQKRSNEERKSMNCFLNIMSFNQT